MGGGGEQCAHAFFASVLKGLTVTLPSGEPGARISLDD